MAEIKFTSGAHRELYETERDFINDLKYISNPNIINFLKKYSYPSLSPQEKKQLPPHKFNELIRLFKAFQNVAELHQELLEAFEKEDPQHWAIVLKKCREKEKKVMRLYAKVDPDHISIPNKMSDHLKVFTEINKDKANMNFLDKYKGLLVPRSLQIDHYPAKYFQRVAKYHILIKEMKNAAPPQDSKKLNHIEAFQQTTTDYASTFNELLRERDRARFKLQSKNDIDQYLAHPNTMLLKKIFNNYTKSQKDIKTNVNPESTNKNVVEYYDDKGAKEIFQNVTSAQRKELLKSLKEEDRGMGVLLLPTIEQARKNAIDNLKQKASAGIKKINTIKPFIQSKLSNLNSNPKATKPNTTVKNASNSTQRQKTAILFELKKKITEAKNLPRKENQSEPRTRPSPKKK